MPWSFFDSNGNQLTKQRGTLAIVDGGTGASTAAAALEALGAGITDNPTFATAIASTAFLPDAADGATLGTAALEFSDLFLADGAVINLGADQDITFTHVHNTGVLLNSTSKIQFGDAGTFIHQSADGVLTIESDTTVDVNGAVVFNGALSGITTIGSGAITSTGLVIGTGFQTGNSGTAKFLDAGGGQYFTLQAADTTTTDVAYKWPVDSGSSGQALLTAGGSTDQLTWGSAGVGLGLVIALGG